MKRFGGWLDREDYSKALGWRNVALLVLTLGWPFMLFTLARSTNCAMDTCGAVSFVFSLYLKPLIYFGFITSLVAPILRRLRDMEMPRWYVAPLLLLLSQGIDFWLVASAPWSVAFAFGSSGGVTPVVVTGFAFLTFFAFASPRDADSRSFRALSMLLIASLLLPALPVFVAYASILPHRAPLSMFVITILSLPELLLDLVPAILAVLALRELGPTPARRDAIGKAIVVLGSLIAMAAVIALISDIFALTSRFFISEASPVRLKIMVAASYARLAELIILMLLPFLSGVYFANEADYPDSAANLAPIPKGQETSNNENLWRKSGGVSRTAAFGRRHRQA